MADSSTLTTLIELAEKSVNDAAQELGKAVQTQQQAEQKLQMLHEYRNDYESNLRLRSSQGLTAMQYSNFLSFLGKLDEAISGQKDVVQQSIGMVEYYKNKWQEAEKKRLTFSTLNKRALELELKKELKRDQKQTDEQAARSFARKNRESE